MSLFETGAWSSGTPSEFSLLIAGDWAPIRDFAPIIENDPKQIYNDLLPLIQGADFSLVNLEAPLSDSGSPVTKSGAVFKGTTAHAKGLFPFDGVTLANNHMFDYGVSAFEETIDCLEKENIRYTGAGLTLEAAERPLVIEKSGLDIAIVNFSEGEDLTAAGPGPGVVGWDLPRVMQQIRDLKAQGYFVIAVAHCGLEYIPFAPPYVTSAFKAAVEAGAAAVIGHHPHVPQGLFFHQGCPICCSLGNFVFFQPTKIYWRKLGYMVKLNLGREGLSGLELIPYAINDQGVHTLSQKDTPAFFSRLKEISDPLASDRGIEDAWNGFLAYYGKEGFKNEVAMIMEKLETEEGKGAAMFRNRLTTQQHFHHWKDILTRLTNGELDKGPDWATHLAREWLTRTIKESLNG